MIRLADNLGDARGIGFPDMNLERTKSRLFKGERVAGTLKETWRTVIGIWFASAVGKIVDSHAEALTYDSGYLLIQALPTPPTRDQDQPAISMRFEHPSQHVPQALSRPGSGGLGRRFKNRWANTAIKIQIGFIT